MDCKKGFPATGRGKKRGGKPGGPVNSKVLSWERSLGGGSWGGQLFLLVRVLKNGAREQAGTRVGKRRAYLSGGQGGEPYQSRGGKNLLLGWGGF